MRKWWRALWLVPVLCCVSCAEEAGDDGSGEGENYSESAVYRLPAEAVGDWDDVLMTHRAEAARNVEIGVKTVSETGGCFVYVNRPERPASAALMFELDEHLKVKGFTMDGEVYGVEEKGEYVTVVKYPSDGSPCTVHSYPVKRGAAAKTVVKAGAGFGLVEIVNSIFDFEGNVGNLLDVFEGDWKGLLTSAAEGAVVDLLPSAPLKLAATLTFEAAHGVYDGLNEGKRLALFDKCTPYIGLKNKGTDGIYTITVGFDNGGYIPPMIYDDDGEIIENRAYCGIVVGKERTPSFYDYDQRTLCQPVAEGGLAFTLEQLEPGAVYFLRPFLISERDLRKANSGFSVDPQAIRYGTTDYIEDFDAEISDFTVEQNGDYDQTTGLISEVSLTVSLPPSLEIDAWGVELTVGNDSKLLYADDVNQVSKTFTTNAQVFKNAMQLNYGSFRASVPVSARVFIQHKGNAFYSYGASEQRTLVYSRKPSIRFSNVRMESASCDYYQKYGACPHCKNRVEYVPCYDLEIDGTLWFDGNYVMFWDEWYAGENWAQDMKKEVYDFYRHTALCEYQAGSFYYTYTVNGQERTSNKILYTWGMDANGDPYISDVTIDN